MSRENSKTFAVELNVEPTGLETPPSCDCGTQTRIEVIDYEMGTVKSGYVQALGPGFVCPNDGTTFLSRVTLLEFTPKAINIMRERGFTRIASALEVTLTEIQERHRILD